ncbi:ecto-NOX disulfide-thiol exchanger 2 [Anopheles darlingi]|uniref:ecto-NOX disulfide-thiol exchanger 2 n=1 Tax=Anopheles darlingi TaxID=43151 RepID=UPI0021001C8B|nr:ecto-NOX disulfide-thiol exchanger 2 [Anopheles darlingi]
MSFSYNPLAPGGLHPMHPLLSGGGGAFLAAQQLGAPNVAAANAALLAGINNKPLEFKMKNVQNGSGAAPMDLESLTEHHEAAKESSNSAAATVASMAREKAREESINKKVLEELHKHQSQLQQHVAAANNGELVFNQLMSQQPPHHHGFMMMPGMMNMVDGSSLISMQTFPMMATHPTPDLSAQNTNTNGPATAAVAAAAATAAAAAANAPPTTTATSDKSSGAKEIIYCKSCTLFPPNPNAPPPKTIERPPGCRTVFVGGLPNGMTEEVMREIFERCGEITTLRLSKKNFCHIRYVYETSVDSAIYLSGYRVKIGSNFTFPSGPEPKEAPIFGVLHVDYAQARDDQYEYECRQRKLQREKRHRERLEDDRYRSLSPQPVVHYTEHEATSVAERLKSDESFAKAVQTLVAWLERGDCSKKNANNFYSMIQSTNSHVRRLLNEKNTFDEELKRARDQYRRQTKVMLAQFSQIEKVFNAASHKKVWDHFTKAQRKNIDAWKKQSLDIKCVQLDDFPDEDGMEMSDDDRSVSSLPYKRSRWEHDSKDHTSETDRASDAVDCSATDNELKKKIMHIEVLQETIRNLQTQLLENKAKEVERQNRICELEGELKDANVRQLLLKTKIATSKVVAASSTASVSSSKPEDDSDCEETPIVAIATAEPLGIPRAEESLVAASATMGTTIETDTATTSEREAKMVALASAFLIIHPQGVSFDQVWTYVGRYVSEMKPKELNDIFARYQELFERRDPQTLTTSGSEEGRESTTNKHGGSWIRFIGHKTGAH